MTTLAFIVAGLVIAFLGFAGGFFYCYKISESYCKDLKKDTDTLKQIKVTDNEYIKALEVSNENMQKVIKARDIEIKAHLERIDNLLKNAFPLAAKRGGGGL
jgi:hypothetical protein